MATVGFPLQPAPQRPVEVQAASFCLPSLLVGVLQAAVALPASWQGAPLVALLLAQVPSCAALQPAAGQAVCQLELVQHE